MAAFCEHGRVKTICPDCRAKAPVTEAERMLARMLELVASRGDWKTLEQQRPFRARPIGGAIEFTPATENSRIESSDNLREVIRAFLRIEGEGRRPRASDVQSITINGSYILAVFLAARNP